MPTISWHAAPLPVSKYQKMAEPLEGAHLVARLTWSSVYSYIWYGMHYHCHSIALASRLACILWRGYGVQSAARMQPMRVTRTSCFDRRSLLISRILDQPSCLMVPFRTRRETRGCLDLGTTISEYGNSESIIPRLVLSPDNSDLSSIRCSRQHYERP